MKEVFVNPQYNSEFTTNGYCVIKDFINEQTILQLEETFNRHLKDAQLDIPFFTTHWSSNDEYRNEINRTVNELLFPLVSEFLPGYKSIFGYYLVKMPGGANHTTIHQDWTLCNENEHTGLTLWCPLVDVTLKNGCFQVVKGSQNFYHNIRGTNIDLPYSAIGNSIEEKYLVSLEVNKGDAVFFDHRLMHASPPNLADKIRIAVGMVLLPMNATVEHYVKEGETINRYRCNDDFLLSFYYNHRQPQVALFDAAKYELIEKFAASNGKSNIEEFGMLVKQAV